MQRITIDPVTGERKFGKRDYVIRTEFSLWMNQRMLQYGMRHVDVANKLHISRQSVSSHASGLVRPTFQNVVSYCWAFGGKDDPEEIWKLVDKKIES